MISQKTVSLLILNFAFLTVTFAEDSKSKDSKCPQGQHWVRAYYRKAYIKADGTQVSATNVSAHCQSDPPSYSQWKDRLKESVPITRGTTKVKSKRWTDEERERVLEALSALPQSLHMNSVHSILRNGVDNMEKANPAFGDSGVIVLNDEAFSQKTHLSRVIAHEMAHEWVRQNRDAYSNYANSTGWTFAKAPSGRQVIIPRPGAYVEDDGRESADEDLANNIECFLYDPAKLQASTPAAYAWIRNKFGDKFKLVGGRK